MLAPERRRRLLDELRALGSAQVEQLAQAVGVSPSTVRRDLVVLERDGLLRRAHGGAYLDSPSFAPRDLRADRPAIPTDEVRQRIGRAAAERVVDGMTVMILAGSTTQAMLPFIADRSVTVVTNGLAIAHALAPHEGIGLVLLGGVLHREQMTLLGPMTERNMADLHVDVMFAGAYGITARTGVTGAKVDLAGYHHSMLRHTDALVVLADATKFGRQGPTLLAEPGQVERFVTDAVATDPEVVALREIGASLTLC